jgi:heme exporter protein A
MNNIKLTASNISMSYEGLFLIFSDINFEMSNSNSIAITGKNGSGKTTLLKILAGVLTPTSGKIELKYNEIVIPSIQYYLNIGLVSPYLNLYDEFTANENLTLIEKLKNVRFDSEFADNLFEKFNLTKRRNEPIKSFSSGMLQRLKYIIALIAEPKVLFLDEPFTNLDEQGIIAVIDLVEKFISSGRIVVIATNEKREKELCERELLIDNNNKYS